MLSEVGYRMDKTLRDTLMLSRMAGDEFICLVADANGRDAVALYERARSEVENLSLEVRPGRHARVRLSFGLARYPENGQTIDELRSAAASAARQHGISYSISPSPDPQLSRSSNERTNTTTGPCSLGLSKKIGREGRRLLAGLRNTPPVVTVVREFSHRLPAANPRNDEGPNSRVVQHQVDRSKLSSFTAVGREVGAHRTL